MNFDVYKYHKYQKGPLWYILFISIMAFFSYRSFMDADYFQLFLYGIVVCGLAAYLLIEPHKTSVSIDNETLMIENNIFIFSDMRGYMYIEDNEVVSIHFFLINKWKPTIKLILPAIDSEKVLKVLEKGTLTYLEDEKEPLVDYYLRLFRF